MICPNCGASLPDTATLCYICRFKFSDELPESEKNTSELKRIESPISSASKTDKPQDRPVTGPNPELFSNVQSKGMSQSTNTSPKGNKQHDISGKGLLSAFGCVILAFAVMVYFSGSNDKKEEKNNAQTSAPEQETVQETAKEPANELDEYAYSLDGKKIEIYSYNGDQNRITIHPTYTVNGVSYKTNLSDFQLGMYSPKEIVFEEGIEEIPFAAFNGCSVTSVYYPKSVKLVYDLSLAYLDPPENGKTQIYYAGTEDEWNKVFTKYERKKIKDAESPEEKGESAAV